MLEEKGERTTEHRGGLEWSFKVTLGCFPEYMNSDNFCVIQILQAHEGLDKKGLSVLHVDMEEGHHGDTKVRATELEHIWDKRGKRFDQMVYIRILKSPKDHNLLQWS